MPTPDEIWTNLDTNDWAEGQPIREDKLKEHLQNQAYLKAALDSVGSSIFWTSYRQRLQTGGALGHPIP